MNWESLAADGPAAAKVAILAAVTAATAAGGWATALIAQVQQSGASATAATVIPATALTATSGALVWVVKQIVSGNLVHRNPASAEAVLADAASKLADLSAKAIERERVLTDLLIKNSHHND